MLLNIINWLEFMIVCSFQKFLGGTWQVLFSQENWISCVFSFGVGDVNTQTVAMHSSSSVIALVGLENNQTWII